MYPLLPGPETNKVFCLGDYLVKKEPQSMEVEQIETITPAESPAPSNKKESPVEMQVETEDTKESPIVNDQ